jgi:biopolymer transport protein ExbD
MRISAKKGSDVTAEGDMTPMIDMTFQLIAFLMVMINFTEVDQNAKVVLPKSELARPADKPLEKPITLHVLDKGEVILGGQVVFIEGLKALLGREADAIVAEGKSQNVATIIVRAHRDAPVGKVQEIIKACQESGFEKFALRAEEDVGY